MSAPPGRRVKFDQSFVNLAAGFVTKMGAVKLRAAVHVLGIDDDGAEPDVH